MLSCHPLQVKEECVLYCLTFRFESRRRRHASWFAAPVYFKATGCATRSFLCFYRPDGDLLRYVNTYTAPHTA